MRYCWTLVMAAGLLGMNAAGWMAYQSKPKAAVPPAPKAAPGNEKDAPPIKDKDAPPIKDKDAPPIKDKDGPRKNPPARYLESMEAGEQALKNRRWRDAVARFTAAAELWEDGRAKAEARIKDARDGESREFSGLITQARELMKKKELAAARDRGNEALAMGVGNAEARGLLDEIDRLMKPKPPPEKKLAGDVLVLVLHTPTSSLAANDFRAGLKGLEDVLGKKGTLLGGKVWVLDSRGPQPWDQAADYPATAALDNRDFAKLIDAIKDATAKLDAQAVKPKFRVVVVWETDNKIAGPIPLPDRRYWLAYRYTLGDEDIADLDRSFVIASRFRSPGTVQKEVTYVATKKALGGTP